jgi:hypothetical protein
MLGSSTIPFRTLPLSVALASSLLASCGGGGSSPTPTPANSAPQFTSGATASVAENSTGVVYTATATDANGDALTFSIAGGADAARFTMTGAALSFAAPPNFDAFADANNDNVYSVTLQASDGRGGTTTRTVDVTVTNDREGIRVTRIATGFVQPVGLAPLFNRNILVAQRNGTVWNVDGRVGSQTLFSTVPLPAGGEVLDVAGRVTSGFTHLPVLVYRDPEGVSIRFAFHLPATSEVRLATGAPGDAGAKVSFAAGSVVPAGIDSVLVAVGDPGGQRAQGTSGYGQIFAPIAPSLGSPGQANPLGRGIRQPGGFVRVLDSRMFLFDRGGTAAHEINPVFGSAMSNFGWPFFEGTLQLQAGAPTGLVAPLFTYPFGTGPLSGSGPTTGDLYFGSIVSLQDRIVFADGAKILTLGVNPAASSLENRSADFVPNVGGIDQVVKVMVDASNVLYILDADGELFRVDPA